MYMCYKIIVLGGRKHIPCLYYTIISSEIVHTEYNREVVQQMFIELPAVSTFIEANFLITVALKELM